jgi:hypothetical protein
MKNLILPLAALLISACSYSQTKVSWGKDFSLHREVSGVAVINADNTGAWLEESHAEGKMGWWGVTDWKSATLVKLNPSLVEVYRKDYDKDLKDKNLESFLFIRDKLYLFASGFEKKDKTLNLYAAEIDKNSGNLRSDWQQLSSWDKSQKEIDVQFRIVPNTDSSKIVLISAYTGKTGNRFEVKVMDVNLRSADKPYAISNEFDPLTFQLEDFVYTSSGDAILIGRSYEMAEGSRKKDKSLLLHNYNIRMYDNQGKLKKELVANVDGAAVVGCKVVQWQKELLLAAFYSKENNKKQIDGMLVQRIDLATGNIIASAKKDMDNSLITEVGYDYNPKLDKKDEEDPAFSTNLRFRNFYLAPDNGIIILAEQYETKVYEDTYYRSGGGGPGLQGYNRDYQSGDIYMCRISPNTNIDWLNVLPRRQKEEWDLGNSFPTTGFINAIGFFDAAKSRPFWSGFGCLPGGNTINIVFNDDERNADVKGPGKKVWKVSNHFGKLDCYQVSLDMLTGKFSRNSLFTYKEFPTPLPVWGAVFNKTMYLPRIFYTSGGGKANIAVGTITTNP